ncbi:MULTISPECIES: lanthionine synthetase LanC family protein [unclassified Saccharothrix]|uniref:lanthionine synthetase LanC family protein n=1 Tax=unclassified Saccharothrix TaxID=2593673 RepID=UPI00307DBD37
MRAAERLVLAEGVTITPVRELPDSVRQGVAAEDGDQLVARAGVRSTSRVVSAATADLLTAFHAPATIVDAVLDYARRTGLDPETVLEAAAPVVVNLVNARLLAVEGSSAVAGPQALLDPGDVITGELGARIREVVQVQEDVDVYRAGRGGDEVAVKIARGPGVADRVEHERRVLLRLDGVTGVRLVDHGRRDGLPWLAVGWVTGQSLDRLAAGQRSTGRYDEVARVCVRLARAYAAMHGRGVVHGDVHPRNVIVTPDARVAVIDYGYAVVDGHHDGPRAGVGYYLEPELARARLAHEPDPPATTASDQYALAVMIYTALTGAHPLDLPLERDEALRRITTGRPAPFRWQGVPSWEPVEAVLRRALATDPARRHPTMSAFADALSDASRTTRRQSATAGHPDLDAFVDRTAARYTDEPDRRLIAADAPACSVYWGAAGIAWALVELSRATGRPELLEAALRWTVFGRSRVTAADAFSAPSLDLPTGLGGSPSLFHGEIGLDAVHAIAAVELGLTAEITGAAAALTACVERADRCGDDPSLGPISLVWAAAALLDAAIGEVTVDLSPLTRAVDDLVSRTWPALGDADVQYLGMAHGWAGFCHATLRWAQAGGTVPTDAVADRLATVAGHAVRRDGAASWPVRPTAATPDHWSGWCHGTAGHAQLFALAARVLDDDGRYATLAHEAGAHLVKHPQRQVAHLCCGSGGQAAVLVDLWALTGDDRWLDRAAGLAERSTATAFGPASRHGSLFKGDLGIALAAAAVTGRTAIFPVVGGTSR